MCNTYSADLADTDYSSMTFEDRLMVLRGLVDAVTATDRFGEYIDQVGSQRSSFLFRCALDIVRSVRCVAVDSAVVFGPAY